MELIANVNTVTILGDYRGLALLITRIIFAATFFYYGWPKLRDLKANAEDFEGMGFKPGWFWGTPIALLESLGSVLILLGLFLAVLPLLFAAHMATGTVWKITSTGKPFTDWSYDLLLLALSVLFLVTGPGSITAMALLAG